VERLPDGARGLAFAHFVALKPGFVAALWISS